MLDEACLVEVGKTPSFGRDGVDLPVESGELTDDQIVAVDLSVRQNCCFAGKTILI
ncbi:MAG: hypothetical protein JO046_03705, partial [Solirubrobacterales bacterium]|nr:hypothetical protein [Solirubrobacterales bacterium]